MRNSVPSPSSQVGGSRVVVVVVVLVVSGKKVVVVLVVGGRVVIMSGVGAGVGALGESKRKNTQKKKGEETRKEQT